MTDQDWARVWELLHAVKELPAAQRATYLSNSSAHAEIVDEVLAMLEEDESETAAPAPGRTFGRYTIVELLGTGGMGEVYAARDNELGRMVAMKFLGSKGRLLPAAMDLLVKEAQAASALNHPNLVTVHEVLRFDAGVALVAELVKGQSLRNFCGVARPVPQVAQWGAQIARALAVAHAESIVHGDIKPENIMLRGDGYIKLLDFGLAQRGANTVGGVAKLPLGTIGYMSPEQTKGLPLGGASDVFSLGVLLFELACGRHPFLGKTASATTIAINEAHVELPDIARSGALAGGKAFTRLLRSMLEKDPANRPAAITIAQQLDQLARSRPRNQPVLWGAVGALALVVIGAGTWYGTRGGKPALPMTLSTPVALTKFSGIETQPSLSPDGRQLAFVWSGADNAQDDVYVMQIGTDQVRRLTNDTQREFSPAWSPDGRWLAWVRRAPDGGDSQVFVAPSDGSAPPRVVAAVADHHGFWGMTWLPDSQSLALRDRGTSGFPLVRLNVADGRRELLTHSENAQDFRPALSPDNRKLAFIRNVENPRQSLCVIRLDGQEPEKCLPWKGHLGSAAWLADSHNLLIAGSQGLWQYDFASYPSATLQHLQQQDFAGLSADRQGRKILFSRVVTDSNIWRLDTETGHTTQFAASSEEDSEPMFSPDGAKVVFRSNRTGNMELYVCDATGANLKRITSMEGHLGSARWSPDGKWIAFDATGSGPGPSGVTAVTNIYLVAAEGGPVRRLTDDTKLRMVPGWSADSKWVYFTESLRERVTGKVPISGGPAIRVSDHEMWEALESPDGQWLWYERALTGKGLFRRPTSGGPEQAVAGTENITYRAWDLRAPFLWFMQIGTPPVFVKANIATGAKQVVGPAPKRMVQGPKPMTASPDGRTILYSSEDLTMGDIFFMDVTGPRL